MEFRLELMKGYSMYSEPTGFPIYLLWVPSIHDVPTWTLLVCKNYQGKVCGGSVSLGFGVEDLGYRNFRTFDRDCPCQSLAYGLLIYTVV